jgi:hypothetical protein
MPGRLLKMLTARQDAPVASMGAQMNLLIEWWRRARGAGALLTVSVVVAGAACTLNPGPKYPFVTSFCEARATAECSTAVILACALPSMSTCVSNREQICVASQPPNTDYDPDPAQGCVNAVMAAYADAEVTLAESQAIDSACGPVFSGPGAQGAPCQVDTDCQSSGGLQCVLAPASAQGTCQVPMMVEGGGSCAQPNQQCVSGFHCGVTANCDIDRLAGEPCDPNDPCGVGLACAASGMCQSKSPDGTTCTSGDECLNGICNKGATATTGLCVSEITLSPTEPFCTDSR